MRIATLTRLDHYRRRVEAWPAAGFTVAFLRLQSALTTVLWLERALKDP